MTVAREACKKHHDGELKYYKTMAIYVKEQLDAKLGNSWHVCVGKFTIRQFQIFEFQLTNQNVYNCDRHELWKLLHIRDKDDLPVLARAYWFPCLEAWMKNWSKRQPSRPSLRFTNSKPNKIYSN